MEPITTPISVPPSPKLRCSSLEITPPPARWIWAMTRRPPATVSTRIMADRGYPGAPGRVDGWDRAGSAAVPATAKGPSGTSPEGPLRVQDNCLVPPGCLRDLLAGSDNTAAL